MLEIFEHWIFYYTGIVLITYELIKVVFLYLWNYINNFFKKHDIKKYLRKDQFALITGATSGIGKAYAIRLASEGFNLILFGRDQKKIDSLKDEINAINNDIKIVFVKRDFVNSFKENFFKDVYEELKEYKINFLINNVGLVYLKKNP